MRIAEIQRFCMHDGPGIRTTLFLKGCPLRCKWCHNPETQSENTELLYYEKKCIGCKLCGSCSQDVHLFSENHTVKRNLCINCGKCISACPTNALELSGKDYTVDELLDIIIKDLAFYENDGGVTLSGGEPFLQKDETIALLKACKNAGINTAVETCGYFSADILRELTSLVDLMLWDIKDTNSKRHKDYTGKDNEKIINNLILADSVGIKTRIRCILVNGVNTDTEHYKGVIEIFKRLKNCEGVELLPYHSLGGTKYVAQGRRYLGSDGWIPEDGRISSAKEYFISHGVFVF